MISLDLQTFRQCHQGDNVTGVIFLYVAGEAYPGKDWLDFPVIILGWWADALLRLESMEYGVDTRQINCKSLDCYRTMKAPGIP